MQDNFQDSHQSCDQCDKCNQASHCSTEQTLNQTKTKVCHYKALSLVLVVCLIATIVWLVFNNPDKPKTHNNSTTTTSNPDSDKPKTHNNSTTTTSNPDNTNNKACFENDKICFNYPKTWQIAEQKKETDTQSVAHKFESFTLSSPSNNIKLKVVSGLHGIGSSCPADEVVYIKDRVPTKLDYLPVTNEQSSRAFIAKIVSHSNGDFYPELIITASKWFENPSLPFKKNSCLIAGEPNTKPMIANKALLYPQVDQHTPAAHGLVGVSISTQKFKNLEEAYAYLDSPESNQAYQIAASLYINQ